MAIKYALLYGDETCLSTVFLHSAIFIVSFFGDYRSRISFTYEPECCQTRLVAISHFRVIKMAFIVALNKTSELKELHANGS